MNERSDVTVLEGEIDILPAKDMNLSIGLLRAEVDQQIATAHQYPRSIKIVTDNILELATLDEETAEECMYSVPRAGKTIEGPSIRLAEIIVGQWGNCRVSARIVREENDFVVAQAVFHDLQTNTAVSTEVQRGVVSRNGKRYSADMVQNTKNSALSIARRNIILAGVPKAVWRQAYSAARQVVMGDLKTLANRRSDGLKNFQRYGVLPSQVFAVLEVAGEPDITLDHLVTMRGMLAALKNQEATVESMFGPPEKAIDKNYNPLVREKTDAVTGEVTSADNQGSGASASTETERRSGGSADRSNGNEPSGKTPSSAETNGSTGETSGGGENHPQEQKDLLSAGASSAGGNDAPADARPASGADGSSAAVPSAPDRLRSLSKALASINDGGPANLAKQQAAWINKHGSFEGDDATKQQAIYTAHLNRLTGALDMAATQAKVEEIIGK